MAHFARLDDNGIVVEVIVIDNKDILDKDLNESEKIGCDLCCALTGSSCEWVQTSYNKKFRNVFAGIGYKYRKDLDAFISPSPFASWVLNEATLKWEPPCPKPDEQHKYYWDESTVNWVKFTDTTFPSGL